MRLDRKNEAERFRKEGEQLHVAKKKKEKKWVPNRFLSVPFRKRAIGAYGPFFTEQVKQERARYRLHVKIHPSRTVPIFIGTVPFCSLA